MHIVDANGELLHITPMIDNELKALIPPLTSDELSLLEASIKADGCRDAVTVWEGKNVVVDGHNRYAICQRNNLPLKVQFKSFDSREDVVVWMCRNQLGRRNIPDYARLELAKIIAKVLEKKGKENMSQGLSNLDKPHNTQKVLADIVGKSVGAVARFDVVDKYAPEPVKVAARRGEISTHQAYELTRVLKDAPETVKAQVNHAFTEGGMLDAPAVKSMVKEAATAEKRAAIAQAAVEPSPLTIVKASYKPYDVVQVGNHWLICADNTDDYVKRFIMKHPRPALAFCDPPYNANVADWDSGDFEWQQDYLCTLADIVAVTPGIGNIPGFMRQTQMPYRWSTATFISNGMTRGALGFGNWIYTALFSAQSSIHRNSQDVYSITINAKDADDLGAKRQKPPMYLSWLFSLLTQSGDYIVDAFGGSGTSVLVADKLKRNCICIERDVDTFAEMVARIEASLNLDAEKVAA